MLKEILLVAAGGAAGSVARHLLAKASYGTLLAQYPMGTMAANIGGCLLIGFVSGVAGAHTGFSPEARLVLTTGFCGGFTTFSTFMNESLSMMRAGDMATAAVYMAASVALGLTAAMLGAWLARLV